ncbi:hypothetical protein pb186bvf_016235 [Paramecium bursaria]
MSSQIGKQILLFMIYYYIHLTVPGYQFFFQQNRKRHILNWIQVASECQGMVEPFDQRIQAANEFQEKVENFLVSNHQDVRDTAQI